MGQTLLANQFITGLRSDLKQKLIGTEGSLQELILKAYFEEAKTQELVGDRPRANAPNRTPRPSGGPPPPTPPVTSSTPVSTTTLQDHLSSGTRSGAKAKCFNCGLDIARNCPYAKRSKQGEEAHGPRRQEPQPAVTT